MPRYLYRYFQMFSYLGSGTPEDPGGDFGMYCWIDAQDEAEALEWGYALLGDYMKHRFAHSNPGAYDGTPVNAGEIEADPDVIADIEEKYRAPVSKVGEFPQWHEPWRLSNLDDA